MSRPELVKPIAIRPSGSATRSFTSISGAPSCEIGSITVNFFPSQLAMPYGVASRPVPYQGSEENQTLPSGATVTAERLTASPSWGTLNTGSLAKPLPLVLVGPRYGSPNAVLNALPPRMYQLLICGSHLVAP